MNMYLFACVGHVFHLAYVHGVMFMYSSYSSLCTCSFTVHGVYIHTTFSSSYMVYMFVFLLDGV